MGSEILFKFISRIYVVIFIMYFDVLLIVKFLEIYQSRNIVNIEDFSTG